MSLGRLYSSLRLPYTTVLALFPLRVTSYSALIQGLAQFKFIRLTGGFLSRGKQFLSTPQGGWGCKFMVPTHPGLTCVICDLSEVPNTRRFCFLMDAQFACLSSWAESFYLTSPVLPRKASTCIYAFRAQPILRCTESASWMIEFILIPDIITCDALTTIVICFSPARFLTLFTVL